ncbi:MAG: hypothetical protein KKH06_00110 [Gammaproteobacteria bacterium]|nr:hypothetical protein [Gammaproteobacteria bacterium]
MYKILVLFLMCLVWPSVYAAKMHDPTRPFGVDPVSELLPSGVQVTSIIIGKGRAVAVIGGRHLKIGDSLLGAKVVDIKPYAVYLKGASGIFTVPILSNSIKKLSANQGNSNND